jgi:hypothetical protein
MAKNKTKIFKLYGMNYSDMVKRFPAENLHKSQLCIEHQAGVLAAKLKTWERNRKRNRKKK